MKRWSLADAYYAMKVADALRALETSEEGLLQDEAQRRIVKYGPNEIDKGEQATWVHIFLVQFTDPLILLLIFAGALSLVVGEIPEAIAIFCIIMLNAIMGFVQEYRAEKAMEALKRVGAPIAKVLRNGEEMKVPAREVVPGDVIVLEAGDIVPADARVIEASSLRVDESALTGESVASNKNVTPFKLGTPITDQDSMIFSGTIVTYGKGNAVVTMTGNLTEFGKIAKSIQETPDEMTPLQKKFAMLAKRIGIAVIFLVILVLAFGIYTGKPLLGSSGMLFLALALTVSTIPNALPVIVTVGLSLGANRLAKKNMLVKRLSAAESLGSATIICTDKTGTLTKNEMTVTTVYASGKTIEVSGSGYEPTGTFTCGGRSFDTEDIQLLLRIGFLCNNAVLVKDEKTGRHDIIGDPTEGSLIVLGRKAGLSKEVLDEEYVLAQELPFDSDRKRMSVVLKGTKTRRFVAFVKGAPDLLLKQCDRILENGKVRALTAKDRNRILQVNESHAQQALRMLGFAYRDVTQLRAYSIENVERDLIFVGMAGMIDPPRDEVSDAIAKCHSAGIKVMMITGDQAITAKAIATRIGLWTDDGIIITGEELERMSDEELASNIERVRIVARALPIQKVRIVDALKKHGHIVAMTGDGVNDAPALKRADIGIAMGSGSDVAREVAKGTLVDDNFSSIVNAIEEGRNLYDKIIKSARYLLSCNAGEITAVLLAVAMAFPLPLLPLQLLLMNLLTDSAPAMGLGTEPPDDGIMQRPPRDPHANPIDGKMLFFIVVFGIIMGLGTMYVFFQYKDADLTRAQTMAFTTLVMIEMFAVVSARSVYPSLHKLNLFSNPRLLFGILAAVAIQLVVIYYAPLNGVFGTTPLSWDDWTLLLRISVFGFIGMEIAKFSLWVVERNGRKKAAKLVVATA